MIMMAIWVVVLTGFAVWFAYEAVRARGEIRRLQALLQAEKEEARGYKLGRDTWERLHHDLFTLHKGDVGAYQALEHFVHGDPGLTALWEYTADGLRHDDRLSAATHLCAFVEQLSQGPKKGDTP